MWCIVCSKNVCSSGLIWVLRVICAVFGYLFSNMVSMKWSKNIFDKLARRARTQILTDDTQIIGSPNYGSLK